jgi:CheY-like chemotaxis protein
LILLVDDDPDARALVARVLSTVPFAITEAGDGKEALAFLERADPLPALVITDLTMPLMSGWELLAILQADHRYRHIPVLVVSADEPHIDAEASGVYHRYLQKPFVPKDLLATVHSLTSRTPRSVSG